MAKFLTHLDGRWIDDERFMLLADLIYESDILGLQVIVPKGFITDFASVPRVPVAYMLFGDRAHHESVIHDFFYQVHITTRAKADKVFLEAMKARGKKRWIRVAMYWGVAIGGRGSYKSGPARYQKFNDVTKKEIT